MKNIALLPLLALAGCGWFSGPQQPATEQRPEYVACRRDIASHPEVRALAARTNTDNPINVYRIGSEREILENRLYRSCLRERGLSQPGGVEAIRTR